MHPIELKAENLRLIRARVPAPAYDRGRGEHRIVHIGPGAFHRAHQATYLDDLLTNGECPEWRICGVALLAQDCTIHQALEGQDYLYTVVELGAGAARARVVGSLAGHLYGPDGRERAISKMAAPECRIISLTVTEGGYHVNQWTGDFEEDHPEIRHDLEHTGEPAGWLGYVAEGLDRRRRSGLPGVTVLSCDNVQHNGDVAQKAVLAFTGLRDPALGAWVRENCTFPNTMVDRITPVATPEHRSMVAREFGIADGCPVVTEPFRQWIIEDRFANGRPSWERAGALATADVLPYEKMKMRLLNGSHQALCYLGMLLGYAYVHQATGDPQIAAFIRTLMDVEVSPLVPEVPGIDLAEYKKTLIERFANPAIGDKLSRIGTDASVRIPKFVLPSIVEQAGRGGPIRMLSLAVAGWFRVLAGTDELADPLAATLRARARRGGADPGALLGTAEVFGDTLPADTRFRASLGEALRGLYEHGASATLAAFLGYQQQ
jgi:mannitol 2-dehydrogenase